MPRGIGRTRPNPDRSCFVVDGWCTCRICFREASLEPPSVSCSCSRMIKPTARSRGNSRSRSGTSGCGRGGQKTLKAESSSRILRCRAVAALHAPPRSLADFLFYLSSFRPPGVPAPADVDNPLRWPRGASNVDDNDGDGDDDDDDDNRTRKCAVRSFRCWRVNISLPTALFVGRLCIALVRAPSVVHGHVAALASRSAAPSTPGRPSAPKVTHAHD